MALSNEKDKQLRKRLIEFFRHRNCKFADDLADETLYRLRAKLKALDIPDSNIERYAIGIAKNVWHEGIRNPLNFSDQVEDLKTDKTFQEKSHQPDALKIAATQEQHLLAEAEELCLKKCLKKLPDKERLLILEYYKMDDWNEQAESRKRLMKTMNLSSGTLASKVARIREVLKGCINRCLGIKK